jgi:Rod binding domain-containing protein
MQIEGLEQLQISPLTSRDDARLAEAKRASEAGDSDGTARQFETIFATMLVRELRRCMPQGIFGDGAGADIYEGWFDEHLGNALAREDALGISTMIKTSISHKQAAVDSAAQAEKPPESAS